MKNKEPKRYSSTWLKIKNSLIIKGIKGKEKTKIKEQIGFRLIEQNKLYARELFNWCDIFNTYKPKIKIFYQHAKSYKGIFNEIKQILEEIKNGAQLHDREFNRKIPEFVYRYTENGDYKEICKGLVLIYSVELINHEMLSNEIVFDDMNFSCKEFELNELVLNNLEAIGQCLTEENNYFDKEIKKVTMILDKISDVCENQVLLNRSVLNELKIYLETHQNFTIKNLKEI